MVFMIKLPPALAMAPPTGNSNKDDGMSLLKNLHRPYGHTDAQGSRQSISGESQQQYGNVHQQQCQNSALNQETTLCGPSRQKMVVGTAILLAASLVVFFLFVTTYGKFPTDEMDVIQTNDIMDDGPATSAAEVVVKTDCGDLMGKVEDGAYAFKGIPYAKSPTGHLRWRKPVPLWIDESWCEQNQKKEAFHFGSSCFQLDPYSKHYKGKENCLFINVWTPKLDVPKGGLEVMVYIHGGFLQFGSGHEKGLTPSGKLAKKLNIVFVSFNYRLYTLGFLALDTLFDNILTDSKGNYGIWDQLCALQWVKDNIKNFGGDPRKVTLFGPDSGAASILTLMTFPKSQGLFRSVWLIGPTMIFNKTFTETSAHNRAHFLQRSGCTDAQCLRKSLPEDLISAHLGKDDASFRIRDQNDLPIQGIFPEQLIVIDGELLKNPPTNGTEFKQGKIVPILIGSAAQAVDFWPGPDDLSSWTWNQYKKYVTTSLDSFGLAVSKMALSIYNDPEHTAEYLYTTMVSDIRQSCPVNQLAFQLAELSRSPVYRYIMKSAPSKPVKIYSYKAKYSFHMWELIAFFDELEQFLDNPTPEDLAFRDTIQKTILTLVKSGGHDVGNSKWLKYPKKSAELSQNITIGAVNKTECKFWSESGLGIYAWVS